MSPAKRVKWATQKQSRIIVLGGSKGGCGRSTIARNLLVLAAQSKIKCIGIDLDRQATLARWAERRERARVSAPALTQVDVIQADLADWQSALAKCVDRDLIVIDTAPGVEMAIASMRVPSALVQPWCLLRPAHRMTTLNLLAHGDKA
jgi:chromosome partitioning protein